MLKRLLLLRQIPRNTDLGLLVLRVVVFLSLFYKHGAEKIFTFGPMLQQFSNPARPLDPLHLGPFPTLLIAAFADGICTWLIVIGLATRWAVLFLFGNLFVVWSVMDHFAYPRKGLSPGESLVAYLAALVALFITGPGKYSIDGLIQSAHDEKEAPVTVR